MLENLCKVFNSVGDSCNSDPATTFFYDTHVMFLRRVPRAAVKSPRVQRSGSEPFLKLGGGFSSATGDGTIISDDGRG